MQTTGHTKFKIGNATHNINEGTQAVLITKVENKILWQEIDKAVADRIRNNTLTTRDIRILEEQNYVLIESDLDATGTYEEPNRGDRLGDRTKMSQPPGKDDQMNSQIKVLSDKDREVIKMKKTIEEMENKMSNLMTTFEDLKTENESHFTSNRSSVIQPRRQSPDIGSLWEMMLLQNQRKNLSPQNTKLENNEKAIK